MSLKKFSRFLRDSSGNYAIMFAVAAFPIMGTVALAVDYSNLERHRAAVQHSMDAAALATAKQFSAGTIGDALQAYAEDFFLANLPDFVEPSKVSIQVSLVDVQTFDSNGQPQIVKTVNIDGSLRYDTFIAPIVGHDFFDVGMLSQVALGNVTVEVALVMDNSGSMAWNNRINLAKSTAKSLIDTVYNAASSSNKPNPVSFSLVPFSAMVNVGTNNANAKWMDTQGLSPIHHENLNWWSHQTNGNTQQKWEGPLYQEKQGAQPWTTLARFDLYTKMTIPWAGCVEMRPWPHNTMDTVAVTGSPVSGETLVTATSSADDRARLFVPTFAPDEPNRTYRKSNGSYSYDSYSYPNNYADDWKRVEDSGPTWLSNNTNFSQYDTPATSSYSFDYGNGGNAVIFSNQNKRQDLVYRYHTGALLDAPTQLSGSGRGPNYDCTAKPLTPLTTSQADAKAAVDAMWASGMTNIQAGVAWGWRTISPGEPLTGGRDPSDLTNRKYMIVLTDGNNTYNTINNPNQTRYAAWGYGKHGRIDEGLTQSDLAGTPYVGQSLNSFEKKMNAHTVQTCNNAKNDGVTVFTIAFDVPNGSSVKEMLNACAGSGIVNNQPLLAGGQFYFDVDGAELQAAMEAIAAQISEIRILR